MIKKYEELVSKLQQSTEEHKLVWQPTSKVNEFKVTIGDTAVSISLEDSGVNNFIGSRITLGPISRLKIWNKEGKKIDEVSAAKSEFSSDYNQLSDLYETVRRSYFHVDEAIDGILSKL